MMMKGFTKDGKFRPTEKKNQSSLKKSSLDKPDWVNPEIVKQHKAWLKHKDEQERNKESVDGQSQEEFVAEIKKNVAKAQTFEGVMKRIEGEWADALNEDEDLPHVDYDVDISYTGSHGTVGDEYFTLTAFLKGLGDVEVSQGISNEGWNEDEKGDIKEESTEDDYDEWLADTFEAVEDGMYMALRDTIIETYRDRDEEVKKKGVSTLASQNFRGKK